jgi:hypothetical protein
MRQTKYRGNGRGGYKVTCIHPFVDSKMTRELAWYNPQRGPVMDSAVYLFMSLPINNLLEKVGRKSI